MNQIPPDIPASLYEQCLRALHFAPKDKPSLALLEDQFGAPEGLYKAIRLATAYGTEIAAREHGYNGQPIKHLDALFAHVGLERAMQLRKFGIQAYPDGTSTDFQSGADAARNECQAAEKDGTKTWRHILREEYWEAIAEEDTARLRQELVQVIAVCAAWIEDIDTRD